MDEDERRRLRLITLCERTDGYRRGRKTKNKFITNSREKGKTTLQNRKKPLD